jgi:hypothetical protein
MAGLVSIVALALNCRYRSITTTLREHRSGIPATGCTTARTELHTTRKEALLNDIRNESESVSHAFVPNVHAYPL